MKQNAINKINQNIYRSFPEVRGVRPTVRKQSASQSKSPKNKKTYLLIYKGSAKVSGKKSLPRIVRVVSSEDGNILKVSTSR